jgi:hypothetical protein
MITYPLSRYELDQHVDAGITNLSGTVDAIPHALAAIVWSIDRHVAAWVISVFDAAFRVDVTSPGSPLAGAAARVSRQLYAGLALPLMETMVVLAGLWAVWELLVMRRYSSGASRIGVSVAYAVVALAIALAPARTVGVAAQASHEMARAALAATLPAHNGSATGAATAALHDSLIHEPWILLDFGAATHCVDAHGAIADPTGYDPHGTATPPPGGHCLDSHRLAPAFLSYDPGSDQRNHAYDALNSGGALARSAVRIQTGGAGYDRVAIAIGLLIASTGAFVLVGGLALGMIASQLYALLLVACAPAALLAALVPGHGHHLFEVWARQLVGAVFRGAVYCTYLCVATALSIALARAAPAIGQVSSLALQATLWWGLVIYGRQLSRRLAERTVTAPATLVVRGAASRAVRAVPIPTRAVPRREETA